MDICWWFCKMSENLFKIIRHIAWSSKTILFEYLHWNSFFFDVSDDLLKIIRHSNMMMRKKKNFLWRLRYYSINWIRAHAVIVDPCFIRISATYMVTCWPGMVAQFHCRFWYSQRPSADYLCEVLLNTIPHLTVWPLVENSRHMQISSGTHFQYSDWLGFVSLIDAECFVRSSLWRPVDPHHSTAQ